nr:hypothetical protein Iba_chr15cCG8600 [Ipomoea batatas]
MLGQALHSRLFSPFIVLKPAYLFGWEKLFYTTICMTPKALCIFWNCCFCIEIRNAIEEPLSANISGGKTCRFFMTYHGMQYFLQTYSSTSRYRPEKERPWLYEIQIATIN